jgi:hypothetical protein
MQAVRKHTAHHQNARALELFPAAGRFAPIFTAIDTRFGTLKFGHVEIQALSANAPGVRLPQRRHLSCRRPARADWPPRRDA